MPRNPKYVDVTVGIRAKNSPNFLISDGSRLFLTMAVIEYDPDAATDEAQRRGVELMRQLFERARGTGDALEAYPIDTSNWVAVNTEPPGVGTDPPGVGTQGSSVGSGDPEDK